MSSNCTVAKDALDYRVVRASFSGIILLLALLLNVKTFIIIAKQKRESRRAVSVFLLNMTLASGLIALFLIPFDIYAIIENGWGFGKVFCKINGFSSVFLYAVLTYTLMCITADRYLSVIKPFRHRVIMSQRTAYRMLVAVYLLSLLTAILPITGEATYEYHPGTNHCSPAWQRSCAYYFFALFIGFVIPILGMLVTYTRIFLTLRANRRLISHWNSSSKISSRVTAQMTGTRVELAVDAHIGHAQENSAGYAENVESGDSKLTQEVHAENTRGIRRDTRVVLERNTNATNDKNTRASLAADTPSGKREGLLVESMNIIRRNSNVGDEITSCALQQIQNSNVIDDGMSNASRTSQRQLAMNSVSRGMKTKGRFPQEYKIARTGFMLVLTFAVLWGPYLVVHSCLAEKCRASTGFNAAMFLAYLNTVANPVVYALTDRTVLRNFRLHIRRVCPHC